MIKVIDNFVNASYYDVMESNILSTGFPWGFHSSVTNADIKDTSSNMFGFTHMIFDAGKPSSQSYQFLLPMFLMAKEETDGKILIRARGDMTVFSDEQVTYEPHIDMARHKDHVNMIFYVGDSDGDTIIYKETFLPVMYDTYLPELPKKLTEMQRVTPKANRLVIFNGDHWHTGQSPKEHSRRVLINFNLGKLNR